MSRTFKAITNNKIDWQLFLQSLCKYQDDVQGVDKNPTYYFYNNNYSARGVDVTEEEDGYEIRTTSCSNAADYLLANNIASAIKEMTDAVFVNEEEQELFIGTLFYDLAIAENTYGDVKILKGLLTHTKDVVLYGPNRPFHIQREFARRINELSGDNHAIAYKFSQMMLRCQYPPEEFGVGKNLIAIEGKNGDKYIVQCFFNTQNMVLENVKAIGLGSEGQDNLYIEPKHLVQFLPDGWELLDEFTIAAKVLPAPYWQVWYQSMIPFGTTL